MAIEKTIVKKRLRDSDGSKEYWAQKTPLERVAALEELREAYIQTLPDAEQRFQYVLRIVRRKKS